MNASIFLLSLLLPVCASEITVSMTAGSQKCFGEELAKSELMVIKADVTQRGKSINLFIFNGLNEGVIDKKFDKFNNKPIFSDLNKSQVYTALTSTTAGPHWVCLESTEVRDNLDVVLSVKYGAHAKDYSQIAKRDHLEDAEKKLIEIHDILKTYHSNMIRMREKEDKIRDSHETASTKVMFYSLANLLIVVVTGGLQLYYFKRFFKSKKII